ncbi:hypothetical protein [Spirosoma terrae]|uniref:Uncharacterized protein n=1 Tax=Spirosoma terrae TaxID=1968276 RepID=A0A6L9LFF9_9BACT|nr:hypothetical protein [Spirosoma terrae]NDU99100.1 hypothetical protein [Spirosoma terrae]
MGCPAQPRDALPVDRQASSAKRSTTHDSRLKTSAKPNATLRVCRARSFFATLSRGDCPVDATWPTHFVSLPNSGGSGVDQNPTDELKAYLSRRASCRPKPERYVVFQLVRSTQRPQGLMDEETTPVNKRNLNLYTPVWLGCQPSHGTCILSAVACPRGT